jgi:hypothetical protein
MAMPVRIIGRAHDCSPDPVLSERTVERHLENIYRKIEARNRADATAFALHHRLA